jgi:hypothetical protein
MHVSSFHVLAKQIGWACEGLLVHSSLISLVKYYSILYYTVYTNEIYGTSKVKVKALDPRSPACICMPLNFGHHPRGFTVTGGYMFRAAVLRAPVHMDPACHWLGKVCRPALFAYECKNGVVLGRREESERREWHMIVLYKCFHLT